ncbi:YceD family protein [Ruegeria marina]|uniref:Uncharacterized metal-binding protein YceD, DUF177 family n=1 Tax=Ruegeria marina TaxID=639004 RepID=A0A1G6JSD5_9RHOB|nr:DUF177 domain-containing protein [Ruegeria marina]SDC20896.1 Uncharacterized metal-binding protein YceD, DUF177 family [Ruegeria marina]
MTDETVLRVADLPQNRATTFTLRPDSARLGELARELGIDGVRKLSFGGELRAEGKSDWRLTAILGATVVQPCVVTLEPVTTRIDTEVRRLFVKDWAEPDEEEAEMPENDEAEPLGPVIDLNAVMTEALALALPAYPRKEGVELGEAVFAEPGKTAMTDEDTRPFAGLAALRDKLKKDQ